MNETGLFFHMTPDCSLASDSDTYGVKRQKDRITVVLFCNMDGSEKMEPLVISKLAKPWCFKNFPPQLYADYPFNKRVLMHRKFLLTI